MGYIIWLLVSLGLIALPFVLSSATTIVIDGVVQVVCVVVGIISLLMLSVLAVVTRLYQKVAANEAIVRTGMGGKHVVQEGGILFVPFLHQLLSIKLETMRLEVARSGADALLTSDNLRADLKSEFFVRVQPTKEGITNAAVSLGSKASDEQAVKALVIDKLVNALRSVAAKSSLFELHSNREQFAQDVKNALSVDLEQNGLVLETVTISTLDQTPVDVLNTTNVFDAQGRQRIAEITQKARVETNRLEREAEELVERQDVETRKKVLSLALDREKAEAEQDRDVRLARAEADRQAQEFKIAQEEAVATREVRKQQGIEIAQREKEAAEIGAEKLKEVADVERRQAVEVAQREQEIAIARKEKERAEANAARLAEEAERETADQRVKTVTVVETARRAKEESVIAAQAEAEKAYVAEQRAADAEAYRLQALAAGRKAAAEADAYAKVKGAEADKEAAEKRADGDKAERIVPVEVAARQVEVDRSQAMIEVDVAEKRVAVRDQAADVERKELAQRQEFGEAALEFELRKLQIAKHAEVQVATAEAVSVLLSSADMRIYGDPTTLASMLGQFTKTMGLAEGVEGFFAGFRKDGDGEAKQVVNKVLGSATNLVDGLTSLLRGERGMKEEQATALAAAIASQLPELLASTEPPAPEPPKKPEAKPAARPAESAKPPTPGDISRKE